MKRPVCIMLVLSVLGGTAQAQHLAYFPVYSGAHDTGARSEPASLWAALHPPSGAMAYPMLVWPVGQPLGDDTFLSNYVDDDQNQPSVTDYMGGHDHLYDGHKGTDIAIYNFRLMDKGIPIVAAAAGVVTHTIFHFGDRNTTTPYPDGGNGLGIEHDDGTRAFYWHIRTNSVMVEPGERVAAGQVLAYVGSSGWTPIPHLHFELSNARDPWHGTYHTAPSLWLDQPAYVADAPLWVMDMDLFTLAALGGSINRLNDRAVKERVPSPAVLGSDEPEVYVWVQVQGNRGDRFTVELVQPDGEVADEVFQSLQQKHRYGWHVFSFDLPADMPEGTWTLRITSRGQVLKEKFFDVGDETHYAPRFRPVSGRSVRLDGGGRQETLSAAMLGGTVAYHLVDAPGTVRLEDATLTIDALSDQPYRSYAFQVVATDSTARTDTLWYHLVDPSKPFNPQATDVGTASASPAPTAFSLAQNHPNPVQTTTTISYHLSTATEVQLVLYDMLGREVRRLVDAHKPAGSHTVVFDASGLSSGLYTYRLATASGVQARPMVVIR